MGTNETRPCMHCGKKLPVEASFCMACGRPQERGAPAEKPRETQADSNPFALAEDDATPGSASPASVAPTPEPERARPPAGLDSLELADDAAGDDVPEITLDEEPKAAPPTTEEEPEAGGRTVRMPLADVVAAWAEDAPASPTPDVEAPRVPISSNPKYIVIVLIIVAIVAGVAYVLL